MFSQISFSWEKIVGSVLIKVGPTTAHGSCRVWIGNQVRFFHDWSTLKAELRGITGMDQQTVTEIQVLFNQAPTLSPAESAVLEHLRNQIFPQPESYAQETLLSLAHKGIR